MKTIKDFKIGDNIKHCKTDKFIYKITGFEGSFLITKSGKTENIMIKIENAIKI